jgi:hypothetical protein
MKTLVLLIVVLGMVDCATTIATLSPGVYIVSSRSDLSSVPVR